MKKTRLAASALAAVMLTSAFQPALAALPTIQYVANESVNVEWVGKAPNGVIAPGTVSFKVDFNSKSSGTTKYNVVCVLDERTVVSEIVEIPPATTTEKTFSFQANGGIHDVSVSIYKNGSAVYDSDEKLYLVKPYETQEMDELSNRGVNLHEYRSGAWADKQMTRDACYYAGMLMVRSGIEWEAEEKKRGVYNYDKMDTSYEYWLKHHVTPYYISGYGNGWLYDPFRADIMPKAAEGWSGHTRNGTPQTNESIRAYAQSKVELTKAHLERGFDTYTLEGWNEMNGVYAKWSWYKTNNGHMDAAIYDDFTKPVMLQHILQGVDDNVFFAGITPQTQDMDNFMDGVMLCGLYPFMDTYAAHTYQFKEGFEFTNIYDNRMQGLDDYVTEWGGWKRIQETETGWSTPVGNSHSTLESANEEAPKLYTICEYNNIDDIMIYDLVNDGDDAYYSEHNFGQMNADWSPKPQYLAITNLNNQTSGGTQIGEIDTGLEEGTRVFLYWKEGKPVVIAWSSTANGNDVTWNLPGESVTVYGEYGDEIASGVDKVTLDRKCVYIHGLSDDWARTAAHDDTVKHNAEWLEDWSDGMSASTLSTIKSAFKNAETVLSKEVSNEEILDVIEKYKDAGMAILADGKNGDLEEIEVSQRIYRLFRIVERIGRLYMAQYEGEKPEISTRYDEMYAKTRSDYYDKVQMKQYSDAMRKFARKYNADAKQIYDNDYVNAPGFIAMNNILVNFIGDWFDEFVQYETPLNMGLTIQSPFYDRQCYADSTVESEVNLSNWSHEDFEGTICVFDNDGNKVAETPTLKVKADGGYTQTSVNFLVERPDEGKTSYYTFAYVDKDGETLATQAMPYEVTERFSVEALPNTNRPEDTKSVKFKAKNISDKPVTVNMKVESDSTFSFKTTETQITLAANETKEFEIPIARMDNTKYHFHSYKYEASDENGVILSKGQQNISFPFVVKTDEPISVEDFDGDISSWENAYPIYFGQVDGDVTDSDTWLNADCVGRAFFKWDSEHLYVLVDIYDERYLQTFTGGNMWQGDSIQISIDGDGCKQIGSYSTEDYEFGFSQTAYGNEFYSWYAPKTVSNGVVDWFKVIRNDDMHFSRYLIAMDKDVIPTIKLEEGSKYGMNIAMNDNDYLNREDMFQFTLGTADQKSPGLYVDFEFITDNGEGLTDGLALNIFPTTVSGSVSSTETKSEFTDIGGHWAEPTINTMAKLNLVNGIGDGKFNPNGMITRAEFFKLLQNLKDLPAGETAFADVSEDAWYYEAVTAVKDLLPEVMIGEGNTVMPDQAITREEAVYLMGAVTKYQNDVTVDCTTYPDGAEVSDWAVGAMNKAIYNELIEGDDNGNLNPKANLTRAEAATILYRLRTVN